ncbi:MAG: FAD-dependent oxidoreductase [Thalassovita sp.]
MIVGGGLSGLALAEALERDGQDYLLVEARKRFGGRIKSTAHKAAAYDLGPAWFWPGQPRIAALIKRLNLHRFDQFSKGQLVYENEQGQVQHGRGFASMAGSWRLMGGLSQLTEALAAHLPNGRKRLGAKVVALSWQGQTVTAQFEDGTRVQADRVVIAMPPRLAAQIQFEPALPSAMMAALQAVPTWMAGQAKAIAIYDRPLWRNAGLSGDASSRHGPLVEIHDACAVFEEGYALFGFIGWGLNDRRDQTKLRHHICAQLGRLFGAEAATPQKLIVKDWADDPLTATPADQAPMYAHPTYGLPAGMQDLWPGALFFAGSEMAPEFGGYLEGALEASQAVLKMLRP